MNGNDGNNNGGIFAELEPSDGTASTMREAAPTKPTPTQPDNMGILADAIDQAEAAAKAADHVMRAISRAGFNPKELVKTPGERSEGGLHTMPKPTPALIEWPPELDHAGDPVGEPNLMIPRGKVAMLAAPGGTGKTDVVAQLALCVFTGKRWLNRFTVATPGRVLFVLGEESGDEVNRRLARAARHLELSDEEIDRINTNLDTVSLYGVSASFLNDRIAAAEAGREASRETLRLGIQGATFSANYHTEFYETLLAWIEEEGKRDPWATIIIDPMSRIAGPDAEADNAAATRFIACLEALTKAPGSPTVIVAHHVSKNSAQEADATDQASARGASALVDGARWLGAMYRQRLPVTGEWANKNVVAFGQAKSNYGAYVSHPTYLIRDDWGWRVLTDAEREEIEIASDNAEREAKMKASWLKKCQGTSLAVYEEARNKGANHADATAKANKAYWKLYNKGEGTADKDDDEGDKKKDLAEGFDL